MIALPCSIVSFVSNSYVMTCIARKLVVAFFAPKLPFLPQSLVAHAKPPLRPSLSWNPYYS